MPSIRCRLCGRINRQTVCPDCTAKEVRAGRRDPRSSSERYGPYWRGLRNQVIRDQPWCSRCGSREKLTADHIVEKAAGGTDDRSNLQTLCRSCNSEKSWAARRRKSQRP